MLKPRCLTNRWKSDLCFDWRHLRKQRPAFDKVISGLSIYSDEPIGCYYFLYGHNLLCGHSVWDIISLIASSVQHHGSAENSPEAAGVTFEKCSPLQFHFFQLDCLSIEDFYSLLDPQPHTYNGSRVLVKLWIVSFLWIAYITKGLFSFYHLSVWAPHVWRVFSLEGSLGSSSI